MSTSSKLPPLKELYRIRGPILRSKIIELTLTEFITNVNNGKISVLHSGKNVVGTTTYLAVEMTVIIASISSKHPV
jgi:hypothetical protein